MSGANLEGWLTKLKTEKAGGTLSRFFTSDSNRRWFRIQLTESGSGDDPEVTLCYYKTSESKEPRGWVFLRDVTSIHEETVDGSPVLVIVHPSRTMKLKASSNFSTLSWISKLKGLLGVPAGAEAKQAAPDVAPAKRVIPEEAASFKDDAPLSPPR